ncbi:hypothetical protein F8388_005324 [Cannabis sativa]|uniref:NB-ARC domain-containing protein n=1 Tax=Cannabis sativa TaxID=3483 RepID=A0A7J6ELJ7_CANSA|nr:hypothetical protein F8388_005324 [Cannabis sativa]
MKSDVELAKELHDFQIKWKCLVVLDDIWTTTTWDLLKDAFPTTQGDTLHSKILLTTRKRNVALHVDQHGFLHKPQFLNDKESLELFQKKYFPTRTDLPSNSNDDDERKTDLAKVMLEKCGGLPLAIIVLAGLLSKIHTIYEWELMKTSVLKCMDQDEQHDDDSEYRSVLWVLGLSYTELPPQLKPCFLYLARYPEDATIRVRELCLVLMAEGFISPKRNSAKTTEEVAYDWLCELVERSMIQVKEMSSIGRIKSFCIHDLMRHVCITKAQDEMFLHFIDLRNKEVEENIETTKARRVSIYDDNVVDRNARFPGMVQNMNDSLRYFSVEGPSMEFGEGVFGHVCNHFLMLRVLIIDDMNGTLELPEEIGNLIHLRLFSVPLRKIKEIPSCFGNFRCLQTLRVLASNSILPESMWKLEQLRHLYFSLASNVPIGKFLRSTKSRNIQTLVGICAKDLVQSDFQYLNNLKKLKIYVDPSSVTLFNTPQTLTFTCLLSLQVNNYFDTIDVVPLILSCPRIYKLTLNSGIERLPEINQFSRNLMKLKLSKLNLKNDPMPTLEKLPELRVLVISNHSFVGNEMVCSRGGFHRLESLEFIGLIDLREWKVEENALPRLGYLRIRECRGLRSVPDGLRNIVTLKEIKISYMPKKFKERMEEGGDDFDKVKHVPSRVFFECDTVSISSIAYQMCSLNRDILYKCIRGLRRVPDGVRNIVTLNEMVISNMPKTFKERMEEGGEDFYKVKHVASRIERRG